MVDPDEFVLVPTLPAEPDEHALASTMHDTIHAAPAILSCIRSR